eukprot:GSMAST32.ASY1.ANO1.2147.1 assembled CDS
MLSTISYALVIDDKVRKLQNELRRLKEDEALLALQKAMLDKTFNINGQGNGGQTVFMSAVLGGNISIVKWLLTQKRVEFMIPEKDGYTPMHGAGFQGRAKIAQLLIDHGLAYDDLHEDGYMPIHRAAWGRNTRHTDTVKVFLDAGAKPTLYIFIMNFNFF